MFVGILRIELFFPECHSLKEKRKQFLSIKNKVRSKFNISISEIDNHDLWQRGSLGISVVADSPKSVYSLFQNIEKLIYKLNRAEIINQKIEVYSPDF